MSEPGARTTADILLVEDDPDDIFFMVRAFRSVSDTCTLHHACDGEEAFAFLSRKPGHDKAPRPDLVLLDLNMPRMSGFDLLAAVRNNAAMVGIPFVVLSTSEAEVSARQVLELGAAEFHTKPESPNELVQIVGGLLSRWCGILPCARGAKVLSVAEFG